MRSIARAAAFVCLAAVPALSALAAPPAAAQSPGQPSSTATLIANARAAIERKDWTAADRLIGQAERREPNNPDVRRARSDLTAIRELAGRQAGGQLALARSMIAQKNWHWADIHLKNAASVDPQNAGIAQVRAELAAAKAGNNAARAQGWIKLARADIAAKQFILAEQRLAEAEKVNPGDPAIAAVRAEIGSARRAAARPILIRVGDMISARKDYYAAANLFREAEQYDPNGPDVRSTRARLDAWKKQGTPQVQKHIDTVRGYIAARNYPRAESEIRIVEQFDPGNPQLPALHAELRAAIVKGADTSGVRPVLAKARDEIRIRNWPAARVALLDAQQRDPHNYDVANAWREFNFAVKLAAQRAQPSLNVAIAAIRRRDRAEADRALRETYTFDRYGGAVYNARQQYRDAFFTARAPD